MRTTDIAGDLWTLLPEDTKAKRGHVAPLSPQVQQLLRAVGHVEGDLWVVASPRITGAPLFTHTLAHAARRIAKRTGIEWRVHDLRRTAASHMTAMGVSRLVVSQILNHADHSVTAIYDRHSYLPEMREALSRWGARVAELVGPF